MGRPRVHLALSHAKHEHFVWIISVVLALIGLIEFAFGIGAAFDHAGNWAENIVTLGIVFLSASALLNVSAFIFGIIEYSKNGKFRIWLLLCVVMILVALYMVNMVLHL